MRSERITLANGEEMLLWQADDGSYACPVCGCLSEQPLWIYNEFVEAYAENPISDCPGCFLDPNYEGQIFPEARPPAHEFFYKCERQNWLEKMEHSDAAYEQIEQGLGLTRADIENERLWIQRVVAERKRGSE